MTPRRAALIAGLLALSGGAAAVPAPCQTPPATPLFQRDEPLAVTLRADLRALYRDRNPDSSTWRPATLVWADSAGERTVPLQVRTRGRFRLRRCDVPPIRLRFEGDSVRGTPFERTRRPKLATHCINRDEYEQNLLQEYAIYRVWRLFTPAGYLARLARVTYEDVNGQMRPVTRYGIVLEDPERLAGRLDGSLLEIGSVRQSDLRPQDAALLGVYQYFIGNTDWSVPGRHNVDLVRTPDTVIPVPYDFDWAGLINARYAYPDPRLRVASVRVRVYRGLCLGQDQLEPVLARFEALRDTIAGLFRAVPGMQQRTADQAIRYFNEFYDEIRDRRRFVRESVERTCLR